MTAIVLFDIGGVLGTNGWDRHARARARERFPLDDEFDTRHRAIVEDWESGRRTLDEYLDAVIFDRPRPFSREEFRELMFSQSRPTPESIAVAQRVSDAGRVTMMTMNNESEELNRYRLETFGLRGLFVAFLSSCWLGCRKPDPIFYHRVLGILQTPPELILFIDDRLPNLEPARQLGMQTLHYTGADGLAEELKSCGIL